MKGATMRRAICSVVMITLILVLSVSGCGRRGQVEAVRLGYLQNDLHQLATFVALHKGLYKEEGIQVEVAGIFKAGPELMSAFASRSLDIGYVGEAPATTAVANKVANVKVLAQVNKEGSAIVVGKDSPIRKPKDLEGKIVAVPGYAQVQEFLLRKAFVRYKVNPKKVKVIVIKPPEMIITLETGQIDAFIAWEPHVAKAITSGVGRILLASRQVWEHHPCCCLVADSKFIRENPDKVRGILRAHVRATRWINQHPQEAVELGVKFTGMDRETVKMAMEGIEFEYLPSIEGEIEYVDFLQRLGYIKVQNPRAFTDSFIDSSFLEEILAR